MDIADILLDALRAAVLITGMVVMMMTNKRKYPPP